MENGGVWKDIAQKMLAMTMTGVDSGAIQLCMGNARAVGVDYNLIEAGRPRLSFTVIHSYDEWR